MHQTSRMYQAGSFLVTGRPSARQRISRLAAWTCLFAAAVGNSAVNADPIQAPPASSAGDTLMPVVDEAINITRLRNLDFQQHTPWQIMHGLLAQRSNYTLKNGNQFVNALEFLSTQARYKGDAWFEATAYGGRAHPYNGTPYDFEGHVNQTLAILSMCDVPLTYEFKTGDGRTVTMADMVRHAQMTVNTQEELTWTLWFLTHYLDQDTEWTNAQGQHWSMESLVKIQTAASPYNAPCGGCHGLFAIAYARNAYMQKHGQLRGAWLEADQKLQQYVYAAQSMQNRDGSFATQFFKARGFSNDFNQRIASSGHMLEWLLVTLPKKRLEEAWIRNGIQTLANDLITNATQPADCGPLYHSLHALILYKQRMQAGNPSASSAELARQAPTKVQAGPLVSSKTPDGESKPLAEAQRKEQQAIADPVIKSQTALGNPSVRNESGNPTSEFKPPVNQTDKTIPHAVPYTAPTPATSNLQSARQVTPPVLQPTPYRQKTLMPQIITPNQAPRTAEQRTFLRRLSTGDAPDETQAKSADQKTVEASSLAPVTGAMPILKITDAETAPANASAETQPTTEAVSDMPAPPEAPGEDNSPAVTSPTNVEASDAVLATEQPAASSR
jgi:hypothetical protein